MALEEKIATLINPAVTAQEFDLVRVSFHNQTLQIMVEPKETTRQMSVEDCARISKDVSALLDTEDPIASNFTLEVSSPGLSRPLVKREDYERFSGQLAKVSLKTLQEGRRRLKGRLRGITASDEVILETNFGEQKIPFDEIESAKLDSSEWFTKSTNTKRG